jgi:hypothetical protein
MPKIKAVNNIILTTAYLSNIHGKEIIFLFL